MPDETEVAAGTAVPGRSANRLAVLLAGPFDIRSFSLTGLFVFALFSVMYLLRSVLLPMVLALLLSYLLAPFVRALARCLRLPTILGAGVVLACVMGLIVVGAMRLAPPAAAWMEKAPLSLQRFEEKLTPLKKPIEKVSAATAEIEKLTTAAGSPDEPGAAKPKTTVVQESGVGFPKFLLAQTPEFFTEALMVVILLYFLLAYDGLFLTKLVKIIPRLQDKKRALTIAREIETCISRYLVTVTCINAGLGFVVGLAMWLLKMPNPLLWGVLAMTLNFVPYLGATVGIGALTLAAVLSFDSLGWALVFPATYLAIAVLEGNFITPMILGHSLTVNPIVILIALMFWGWLWGIAGALLAVPILATFKIFCDHIEPLAPVGEFLST